MTIAAGILNYAESPALINRAMASAGGLDLVYTFGGRIEIVDERQEATVRNIGLERAQRLGFEWYLQLDADERLVNGEHLHELLKRTPGPAYPLPYVHESGVCTVAPFKLFRTSGSQWARFVVGCDVIDFGDGPQLLSGYLFGPARELLAGLPHLLHVPSDRPNAATHERLSARIEGTEPRAGYPQLSLPHAGIPPAVPA